jgi:hypothetical protein
MLVAAGHAGASGLDPLRRTRRRIMATRTIARCLLQRTFIVAAAFVLAPDACALSPDLRISQLYHAAWTVKDGAPTGVEALAQTRDGYLWIAASAGLFRFDGVRFERIDGVGGHREEARRAPGSLEQAWSRYGSRVASACESRIPTVGRRRARHPRLAYHFAFLRPRALSRLPALEQHREHGARMRVHSHTPSRRSSAAA